MKFKTTKKEIRENYHYIVGASYCSLQTLLDYEHPIAYSSGVYGWACDYYEVANKQGRFILISTGYNYINHQNVKPDYEKMKEFENRASQILYGKQEIAIPYETKKQLMKNLVSDFVDYILSTKNN
jgi:hypothetical protein